MYVHMYVHEYVSKYYPFYEMDWKAVSGCNATRNCTGSMRLQAAVVTREGRLAPPPPSGLLTRLPGLGLSQTLTLDFLLAFLCPHPSLLAGRAGSGQLYHV